MYDLLLKGGLVLDPGAGINGVFDIGIASGTIESIAPAIDTMEAARTINVEGKLVVPGLIDIHTHVYESVYRNSINPDIAGVYAGVCTVLDAGTGGSHTFDGFAKYVAPQARTRILSMVHIARTGLISQPEIRTREDIDLEATVRVIEAHKPLVQGVKLRLVGPGVRDLGIEAVRLAKQASRETGTRLMVHIGDTTSLVPAELTRQMLQLLEPGDIVTHFFTGNPANILDANGKVFPEVRETLERGVTLDTAHGRYNFSFDAAQRILNQGFRPHCISTDMTVPSRHTVVGSLTEIMSKFLALGFSLEDVVRMTTINPAAALNMEERLGSLAVGREADISVLKLEEGDFVFRDCEGELLPGDKALVPVLAVRGGHPMPLDWGPRPRGWLPEPASA